MFADICDRQMRAPNDLHNRTHLDDDPPENGYSETLYDFTCQLLDHIAQRENPVFINQ